MITNGNWDLAKNENPNRGGVLGAMETGYQRSKIQEESIEVLMDAVRVCSLGQITEALFEVGGQYRRSM